MIREQWQEAHDKATFYKSEQNTIGYWNQIASSESSGLAGVEHIDLLIDYMKDNNLLDSISTVLDVGCGTGDYSVKFAEVSAAVTSMDYSAEMIEVCKRNVVKVNLSNVSYLVEDITTYTPTNFFDVVLACLNPVTYQPCVMDKLLELARMNVIYFSMDTPINNGNMEPVYCGCNSVRYAEQYLDENGITYHKIPYTYKYVMPDKSIREIPFAYLVISK
jgi:SAM-dependent methyltransferase